ncbi:hypothetical protein CC79DRAFT_1337316 [Sarocladium strictum]
MAFPRFAELPSELRLLAWNFVPFPNRVIGMIPYDRKTAKLEDESDGASSIVSRHFIHVEKPHFVYVVQPSHLAVFSLLHVNREARSVWLPRLVQPKRSEHTTLPSEQHDGSSHEDVDVLVRFNTPFINYDTDIFAVFAPWKALASSYDPAARGVYLNMLPFDPFFGLDRNRIRRVGFAELSHGLEAAIRAVAIQKLSALEEFVFIVLGPDPRQNKKATPPGLGTRHELFHKSELEMRVEDLLRTQCDLWSIDAHPVASEPFFNTQRLRHHAALSPIIRPLPKYMVYVKALLWHALNWSLPPNLHIPGMIETRFELFKYVFQDVRDMPCPLAGEDSCTGRHGRDEILDWKPNFEVSSMLICERSWSSTAVEKGLVCPL